jgi:hypothetical protein
MSNVLSKVQQTAWNKDGWGLEGMADQTGTQAWIGMFMLE